MLFNVYFPHFVVSVCILIVKHPLQLRATFEFAENGLNNYKNIFFAVSRFD
jgi:hypothetical protein